MSGHGTRSHRRYSPSQMERVDNCPGSSKLLDTVLERAQSEWSLEGTIAHEIAEHALANGIRDAEEAHGSSDYFYLLLDDTRGGKYNKFYWSIQRLLDYVYGILDEHPDAQMFLEQRVSPPSQAAPGEADGYCDILIWVPSLLTFYVIDYKHGAGVSKNAERNHQLMQYGSGALFQSVPVVDPELICEVILTIVQPRAFHKDGIVREWETDVDTLRNYLVTMDDIIRAAQDPEAPLVPDDNGVTTDHCRFCDAKPLCPAREAKALSIFKNVNINSFEELNAPNLPDPRKLDVDKLGRIVASKKFVDKWFQDCADYAEELMRGQFVVPHLKLVEAQARRVWYGEEKDLAPKIAALAGVDEKELWTKPQLVSITEAEALTVQAFKDRAKRGSKKAAAEEAKRMFAYLTLKQSSGNLVVVPHTDPRPQYTGKIEMFKDVVVVPQQRE